MPFEDLLVQTCKIYRPQHGSKLPEGIEGPDYLERVTQPEVRCRLDFSFQFQSRVEVSEEELIGRNSGMLFLLPSTLINNRDVVVVDTDGYLPSSEKVYQEQYDVEYIDPVLDSQGVHHLEAVVSLRDNPLELP